MTSTGNVFMIIAVTLGGLLWSVVQRYEIQRESIELLKQHRSICNQALVIAERQSRLEAAVRAGYANITITVLRRLGIDRGLPGVDQALIDAFLKTEKQTRSKKDGKTNVASPKVR